MRKKMLLLALLLASVAGLSTPQANAAAAGYSCPICTTYSDGSTCCVSCWCDGSGRVVACTDNYCPPAGVN